MPPGSVAGRTSCATHLTRVQRQRQQMVAAAIKTIFATPTGLVIHRQLDEVADTLETRLSSRWPKLLEDNKADLLVFSCFPMAHWTKIWSTNPLEHVDAEIKRRTNVVGIFPNDASVVRLLVTAVLVEQHDEWEVAEPSLPLRRVHGARRISPSVTSSVQRGCQIAIMK